MKKVLFGLTAVAIGALAVPTLGSAQMPEGAASGRAAPSASGGASAGGGAAPGAAGVNVSGGGQAGANANVRSNANIRSNTNVRSNANVREGRNVVSNEGRTRIQSNIRNDRLAWSGRDDWRRRHHRRDRDFGVGFAPGFAAYGDSYDDDDYVASYDSCWNYVWTPFGYQRTYVCGAAPGFYASTSWGPGWGWGPGFYVGAY